MSCRASVVLPNVNRKCQACFQVHSAVHAARPDITCVWHCHHSDTVAVLTTKAGFLPLTQEAISQWGEFSYHPFEGNAVDLDERQSALC